MTADYPEHRATTQIIATTQRRLYETLIRPFMQAAIESAYAHGDLPLPPLGWCRPEVWYVGDLR